MLPALNSGRIPARPVPAWIAALLLALAVSVELAPNGHAQSPSDTNPIKTLEAYRRFAMERDGDAARGRQLFGNEQQLGCTRCHSIDGRGSKAGPDLYSVGDQFARRELIDAVLRPSATIAVGYGTTIVETKSGDEYSGVLKQASEAGLELMGADATRFRIPTGDIEEERGSVVSFMPEGLQTALSLQEFADLIEYLVSLKQPENSLTTHRGMPRNITMLAHPAALRPFLTDGIGFPRVTGPERTIQSGLVWFGQMPGLTNVFLAADQAGKIWRLQKGADADSVSVFADLTREVFSARGPNGLLGLAFHPRFRENRKYYLKHQVFEDGKIATVLVERLAAPDGHADSGRPSRRLLKIESVAEHHNGGCIEFGPDGFLYFGMGDSAPNHDPEGFGQDMHLLFGKMLRLDVDHGGEGQSCAIPGDNPFRDCAGVRPEIWASGLREPWRFSFDPVTGNLWVADLGQERGDEVDIVRRGENFGWNVYEGFDPFSNLHRRPGQVYVPPIFAAWRKQGTTLVGGRVYRGDPRSSFYGVYIFGDYTSKRIWGLTQENRVLKTIRQIATAPQSITCFAADEAGQIYVACYEGMVYQLDLSSAVFESPTAISTAQTAPRADPANAGGETGH